MLESMETIIPNTRHARVKTEVYRCWILIAITCSADTTDNSNNYQLQPSTMATKPKLQQQPPQPHPATTTTTNNNNRLRRRRGSDGDDNNINNQHR